MTTTTPSSLREPARHPSVRTYERLLALYPKEFRDQYGADMIQLFGDLVTRTSDGRSGSVWPRVTWDLVTSATRERLASLAAPEGRRPRAKIVLAVVLVVALSLVIGNPLLLPLALIAVNPLVGGALFVLPVIGLILLRRSWVAWRTVGSRPWFRATAGVACFVPGAWWMIANDGGGWWTGVFIVMALVYGLGLGAIWAGVTLARARKQQPSTGRKWTAVAAIVAAVVILGGMAAAGFNSYLNSRPPAGDHSPGNASAESRALWDAAYDGDLATVIATIEACADPFVHFDDGGRARSNAELWAGVNASGREPVGEPMLSRYLDIIERLREAEATWTQRCNS
jgi:protein-S-isoprenylcysteine O-methyltransferase Ste14